MADINRAQGANSPTGGEKNPFVEGAQLSGKEQRPEIVGNTDDKDGKEKKKDAPAAPGENSAEVSAAALKSAQESADLLNPGHRKDVEAGGKKEEVGGK